MYRYSRHDRVEDLLRGRRLSGPLKLLRWIAFLLLFAALAFLFEGAVFAYRAEQAVGVVVAENDGLSRTVRFTTAAGAAVLHRSPFLSNDSHEEGEEVTVYYPADAPHAARLLVFERFFMIPLVLGLGGLAVLGLAWLAAKLLEVMGDRAARRRRQTKGSNSASSSGRG